MFHRLSESKSSDHSGGSTSASGVRRASSDKVTQLNGSPTQPVPHAYIHDIVSPHQSRDGTFSVPTRAASVKEMVQLSQGPKAASFRSAGSNGTQSTAHTVQAVPILSAEEVVERSATKGSRHSPCKSESPSKKKKKESKRDRRDLAKATAADATADGAGRDEGDPLRAAGSMRKRNSMPRSGSGRSDQGARSDGAASSTDKITNGAIEKDDLLSDGDEVTRPLSRHTSTLSTRQQSALARTPSFLSRTHTPPPKLMRELTMRRRRQVHATTAGASQTDDDDDITASSAKYASASLRSAAQPTSTTVEIFHLSDVESLDSSRHLVTTPSLTNSRPGTTNQHAGSTLSPSLSPGVPPNVSMTSLTLKTPDAEAKKKIVPGRAAWTPSLNADTAATSHTSAKSNLSSSGSSSPLTLTTTTAGSRDGVSAMPKGKTLLPSTPVPAPPPRKTAPSVGATALPAQSSATFLTAPAATTAGTSTDKLSSTQPSEVAVTSSTSVSNAFDRYLVADGDSVNTSFAMPTVSKSTAIDSLMRTSSVSAVTNGSHIRRTSDSSSTASGKAIAAKPVAAAAPVADKVNSTALATTAKMGTAASPTRTAGTNAHISTSLVTPSSKPAADSPSSNVTTTVTAQTPPAVAKATRALPSPAAAPPGAQAASPTKPISSLASDTVQTVTSPTSFSVGGISVDVFSSSSPLKGAAAPTAAPTPANTTATSDSKHTNSHSAPHAAEAVKAAPQPSSPLPNTGGLQPAKRGTQNVMGLRTTITASDTPMATPSKATCPPAAGPTATPTPSALKLLSPALSEDIESSQPSSRNSASPPIMIQRRARQVQTIVEEDDDVFTSSSAAPSHAMSLATPTSVAAVASGAAAVPKQLGVAALQAIGVNVSLDDEDDDGSHTSSDEDDEEDEEGLLDGFRPDGYDAKRGQRQSSAITLFLTSEDVETSSNSDDDDTRRAPNALKSDFSNYNVFISNVQLSSVPSTVVASTDGLPVPRVRIAEYKPPRDSLYSAKIPTLPQTGNPYVGENQSTNSSQPSRRPTRTTTRPNSRLSRNSLSALDQYGFGLDLSVTSVGSGVAPGAGWKLPKPQFSILVINTTKYKPDPSKIHRPTANTFGRRRGSRVDNDDEEEDDGEYEYGDEADEEWFWEEVEEDEEEEDDEVEDEVDMSEPVIVKVSGRRDSD